jgi:membrane-bound lytic murein transglycosylase D
MLLGEIEAIERNNSLTDEELSKFAAILPVIEPILEANNLHSDFKFLSIYRKYPSHTEANRNSESGVFWSISKPVAKDYGLLISDEIDERKHLLKATYAAVEKLASDKKNSSDWAETLYKQLVNKEILTELTANSDVSNITLDSPKYAPIIDFLAFKSFVEANFVRIGNLEHKMVYPYTSGSGKTLGELSEKLDIDIHQLIKDNQWLQEGKIPPSYTVILYIPLSKYYEIKKLDNDEGLNTELELGFPVLTLNESLSKGLGGTFYTINGLPGIQAEMGDKFINLAYKSGISHKKFLAYNDMQPMDNIHIGQVYYLREKRDKADIPFHISKPEETIWEISQQYAVKLKKLLVFNRLTGITKLQPRQLIWMQEKRPKNEAIQYIPLPAKEPGGIKLEVIAKKNSTYNFSASTENIPVGKENIYIVPAKKEEPAPKTEETIILKEAILDEVNLEVSATKKKFLVHNVEQGDTIASISRRYDVTIKQIVTLNNLTSSIIEVGDKIIVKKN